MLVDLSNERKVKKFYKKLWLYKSFLFRGVKFEVGEVDDKNLKLIVDGLNIKKRKERIDYVYDEACRMIDESVKGKNICGFVDGKCEAHRCMKKDYINGCCRRCRYQTSEGCPSSNFACKLFVCSAVTSKYEVLRLDDIKVLKLFSAKNRYLVKSDYFSKREDVLRDLYTYTLTWAAIRVIFRLIRDQIYVSNTKKINKNRK